MATVGVVTTGLAELGQIFLALPAKLQQGSSSPMRAGVAAAATVIRDMARTLAPYDAADGAPHIRDSIVVAYDKESPPNEERYVVMVAYKLVKYRNNKINRRLGRVGTRYADYSNLFYWRFLEFGSQHQDSSNKFMRPAFDLAAAEAVHAFSNTFSERLTDIV